MNSRKHCIRQSLYEAMHVYTRILILLLSFSLICTTAIANTFDFTGTWRVFKAFDPVTVDNFNFLNSAVLFIDHNSIDFPFLNPDTPNYPYTLEGSNISTTMFEDYLKALLDIKDSVVNLYIANNQFCLIGNNLIQFSFKALVGSPHNLSQQMNMLFIRLPGTSGNDIEGYWLCTGQGSELSFSNGQVTEKFHSTESISTYKNDTENNILSFFGDSIRQLNYEIISQDCVKINDYEYFVRTSNQAAESAAPQLTSKELLTLAYQQFNSIPWSGAQPSHYFKVFETLSQINQPDNQSYEYIDLWQRAASGAVKCATNAYHQTRGLSGGVTPSFADIARALEYTKPLFEKPVIGNYEARQSIVHTLVSFIQTMCHGTFSKSIGHLIYTDGYTHGRQEFNLHLFTYGKLKPYQDDLVYSFTATESGQIHGVCQLIKNSRIGALSLNNDLFTPYFQDYGINFYITGKDGRIVNEIHAGEEYHIILSSPVIQDSTVDFSFFTYLD